MTGSDTTFERLKGGYLDRYLFCTDASLAETERALTSIGFIHAPDAPAQVPGMKWFRGQDGTLRFHPIDSTAIGAKIAVKEIAAGMKTRIDFQIFPERPSDAAYELARALSAQGNRVIAGDVRKTAAARTVGIGWTS